MNTAERVTSGSVGAIIPLIATIGLESSGQLGNDILRLQDLPTILGLVVRIIALVTVGGVVCYMRKTIAERWIAFIHGVVAASLFATAPAAIQQAGNTVWPKLLSVIKMGSLEPPVRLFPAARAETVAGPSTNGADRPFIYPICQPRASEARRFFAGLTGVFPDTAEWYWVVAPASASRDDAVASWNRVRNVSVEGDRKPRLFAVTNAGNWNYLLSMGLNLSEPEATDLARRYSADFGMNLTATTFSVIMRRYPVASGRPPDCHFTHDD